jgi:hypothetical protein
LATSSQEIPDEISTNLREAQRNQKIHHLLTEVSNWAARRSEIKAAALIGSWASHPAQIDAGIDLIFLTVSPSLFRQDYNWMNEISWSIIYLYRRIYQNISAATALADLEKIWTPNPIWQKFMDEILIGE